MSFVKGNVWAVATLVLAAGSAQAAALVWNSPDVAGNAAARTAWLGAIGVTPTYFVDFEDTTLIADNTNISGVANLLPGGLTITGTTSGSAIVRPGTYAGSNPIGRRALAHDESAFLQFDFAGGVDYFGLYDIDHTAGTVTAFFADNTSASLQGMEATGASGNTAEFYGIYRNDMPKITRIQIDIGGDGTWAVDNLEYGSTSVPVPEPATMGIAALGLALGLRRRMKR